MEKNKSVVVFILVTILIIAIFVYIAMRANNQEIQEGNINTTESIFDIEEYVSDDANIINDTEIDSIETSTEIVQDDMDVNHDSENVLEKNINETIGESIQKTSPQTGSGMTVISIALIASVIVSMIVLKTQKANK